MERKQQSCCNIEHRDVLYVHLRQPTETGVGTWPLFKCVCVCVCVCEASLKLTQDWTSSSLHPEGPVSLRSSAAENRKNRGKEKIRSDAATHRITMIAAVPVSRSRTQTVNSGQNASHTRQVKRNILNRDQARRGYGRGSRLTSFPAGSCWSFLFSRFCCWWGKTYRKKSLKNRTSSHGRNKILVEIVVHNNKKRRIQSIPVALLNRKSHYNKQKPHR